MVINPLVIHDRVGDALPAPRCGCKYLVANGLISAAEHYSREVPVPSIMRRRSGSLIAPDVNRVYQAKSDYDARHPIGKRCASTGG